MMEPDYYYTIEKESLATFTSRGSKFLGYAFPMVSVEDFKIQWQLKKKEHPKAAHYSFAYRLGFEAQLFRANDDGEPAGTAGKPILAQLDSKQITNAGIIVVRYFGGQLLGVPGLIQAYKSAASMALQLTPIVQKPIEVLYSLHFNYTQMNAVMQIIKQSGSTIIAQDNQLFCYLKLGIPKLRLEEVLHKLKELHTVSADKIVNG